MIIARRWIPGLALVPLALLVISCNSETLTNPNRSGSGEILDLHSTIQPLGIALSWQNDDFPDIQAYRVDRSESPGDLQPLAQVPGPAWTDTDADFDRLYYYQVSGLAEDGTVAVQSPVISAARPAAVQFLVNGGARYVGSSTVEITLEAEGCLSALIWNGAEADSNSGILHPLTSGHLTLENWELPDGEGDKTVRAKLNYDLEALGDLEKITLASVQYDYPLVLDQTPPQFLAAPVAPQNGATTLDYRVELHWSPGNDTLCPDLEYQVHIWPEGETGQELYRGPSLFCTTAGLPFSTTYFWQVMVRDQAGNQTEGPVWSFSANDDLVLIEPGTFLMGSPYDEPGRNVNETQHSVTLSRSFRASPYEVTQEMWEDIMAEGDSRSQLPQGNVSWDQAIQFCNALSLKRGLDPAYDIAGPGQVTWDPQANGYRLLTEAEWEYACRASATSAFANGQITDVLCQDPVLDEIGRYCGNGNDETGPVGQLPPNAWGLHDMHGNLWEWCWDYYLGTYHSEAVTDPVTGGYTQDSSTVNRVIRGGNFCNHAQNCRAASRSSSPASHVGYGIGFRLARSPN